MSIEKEAESITADQAQLLAYVNHVEKNINGELPHDGQGNPIEEEKEDPGNPAAENRAILQTLISILSPAMPFLKDCYPPETIECIANAYTEVELKYGWNVRGMMGVEVQLAIVAIPPTISAIVLGRQYFAEKKRKTEVVINPDEVRNGSNE